MALSDANGESCKVLSLQQAMCVPVAEDHKKTRVRAMWSQIDLVLKGNQNRNILVRKWLMLHRQGKSCMNDIEQHGLKNDK